MFRCILCLEHLDDAAASDEHIFPQALGGILTLREMCVPCNSHLGLAVDARLANHRYMQWSRKRLLLAERSGRIPNPLERGIATNTGQQVRWGHGARVYYHPSYVERANGEIVLVVDKTDAAKLPAMLEKARKRRGVAMRGEVMTADDSPLSFELGFDDEGYRFGILKVAYELACKVLGPSYLEDPVAARYRSLLVAEAPARERIVHAGIRGQFGGLYDSSMLPFRTQESWLVGLIFRDADRIRAYVRFFDRFDGQFIMSDQASRYALSENGHGWITDVAQRALCETDRVALQRLATEGAAG